MMRKAAGIIMIILGVTSLSTNVVLYCLYDYPLTFSPFGIFMIIWNIFTFIGGVLCLKRRYWGICLASALAVVVFGIAGFSSSNPVSWFVILGGIVSTIFISRTKKEWQKS